MPRIRIVWALTAMLLGACRPATAAEPTAALTVTAAAPATSTHTAAPAVVIEEDPDPPTATPLPKATFYFMWEPG